MISTLTLIKGLDTSTPDSKHEKLKPRRQRRQEMRDRIQTIKASKK